MFELDHDGFILFKDYFSEDDGARITRWGDEINGWLEMKGKWMIYFEQGKQKARIENFIRYHPELEEFLNHVIKPLLEETIGERVELFKDKMNWKLPGGKGFAAHQDHPAWSRFQPSIYYTVALFVDHSTEENGCLEFARGHGGGKILPYNEKGNGSLRGNFEWEKVPTTPRDVFIFSSFAPHRSGPNCSDGARRIFYFTFNKKCEGNHYDQYIKDKREEFPPDIEREEGKEYKILGNKYNLANPIV